MGHKHLKFLVGFMMLLSICIYSVNGKEQKYQVNLKLQTYVLGPNIELGDIATIDLNDQELKSKIKKINLGPAAPPGEAKELTRSFIRAKIRQSAYFKYAKYLQGPNLITIYTIPNEMRNAFIHESLAENELRENGLLNNTKES